jgi:hypothetical protein
MALTLDETLSAAQDSLERQPIVEVISTQTDAAIPFDGEYFNFGTDLERDSNLIAHSSGRMVAAGVRLVSGYRKLVLLYTDTDKTFWTEQIFHSTTLLSENIQNLHIVEMPDGNIGVVVITYVITYKLQYMIISQIGNVVTALTVIESYGAGVTVYDPFVLLLAGGTYLLVYGKSESSTYQIKKRTSSDFITWEDEGFIPISLE